MIVSPLITTTVLRTASRYTNLPSRRIVHFLSPSLRNFHLTSHQQTMYWNRETSASTPLQGDVIREARIIALSDPNDAYNDPLYNGPLPEGSKLLAIGSSAEDFDTSEIIAQKPNVIFVSHPGSWGPLVDLLQKFPSVEWVHTRSAGIDFIASEGKRLYSVLLNFEIFS